MIATVCALLVGAPAARADTTTTPTTVLVPPRAYLLVDSDTRHVIAASNERQLLPPASTTKILTAITAARRIPPGTPVTATARAEGEPAMKINVKNGQVWNSDDLFRCLLLPSANDAAMALAEQASGSAEAFQQALQDEAARLGLQDHPVLLDPAGLDDNFSIGGGNLMSARDLAIAGRALMADPVLAGIVALRDYRFTGGDGLPHRVVNHDRMLSLYAGANGVKTGYTKKAKHTLVASATRNGRTMMVVILGGADQGTTYLQAGQLLDQGFGTPVEAEPSADILPPVPETAEAAATAPTTGATGATGATAVTGESPPSVPTLPATETAAGKTGAAQGGTPGLPWWLTTALVLACVLVGLRIRARRRIARRRSAARAQSAGRARSAA